MSGFPRGVIPPCRPAQAQRPGKMVGAEIARTGCGQALSARERAAPGTDFIRLAQNIASSEIATVTPR